jgi:hypothetical protein
LVLIVGVLNKILVYFPHHFFFTLRANRVRDIQTFDTETFALFGTHKFLTPGTNYFELHGSSPKRKSPSSDPKRPKKGLFD